MIRKFYNELYYMTTRPCLFAKTALDEASCGNLTVRKPQFIFATLAFLAYTLIAALVMYFTPSEIYSAMSESTVSVDSPLWMIISVSLAGSILTTLATSSMMCAYSSFLGKGIFALRLLLILFVIPALVFVLFMLPFPKFLYIIFAILAIAAFLIPAFKFRRQFIALMYCFLMFSVLLIVFEFFFALSIAFGLKWLYIAIQTVEAIAAFVFIIGFCKGVSGLSSAKSFAVFLCWCILMLAYLFPLMFSGLLSPEISQILTLS